MQYKESKKDFEKSQKKVKSNPEISLESNKSIKKVQSQPETPIVSIEPLDQRIKKAETLRMLETFKSIGSRNDKPKYLTDPKLLAKRPKQSKQQYEEAFGKPSETPEDDLGETSPNQSKNKKVETNKSLEDLSNEDSESISLLKSIRDNELQFSFREYVKGPRDPRKATSFISYLNRCEGENRTGLVTSRWFLPLVTKAIRDLINPSQLKVPMTLTNSDQGFARYIHPGFVEGPPDKYRALTILRDFSERPPDIQTKILSSFGTYMRKAFKDLLGPEPSSGSDESLDDPQAEDCSD